jgi:hypothetical protein
MGIAVQETQDMLKHFISMDGFKVEASCSSIVVGGFKV